MGHLHYLRELLNLNIVARLVWFDTRDMTADGLTKGSIDREALQKIMLGHFKLTQTIHSWTAYKRQ